MPLMTCVCPCINPVRTAVPFWGQTTQILSSSSPKRDCGPKGAKIKQIPKRAAVSLKKKVTWLGTGRKTKKTWNIFYTPGFARFAPLFFLHKSCCVLSSKSRDVMYISRFKREFCPYPVMPSNRSRTGIRCGSEIKKRKYWPVPRVHPTV